MGADEGGQVSKGEGYCYIKSRQAFESGERAGFYIGRKEGFPAGICSTGDVQERLVFMTPDELAARDERVAREMYDALVGSFEIARDGGWLYDTFEDWWSKRK